MCCTTSVACKNYNNSLKILTSPALAVQTFHASTSRAFLVVSSEAYPTTACLPCCNLPDFAALCRSIDLLPPKTATGAVYTALLLLQLAMIVNAYCPSLLFTLPDTATAAPGAVAAAADSATGVAAVAVASGVSASATGAAAAAAATEAALGVADPLLRMVKYAWGSGFFIAAFACNCLKTAADRHHSWAPQNRSVEAGTVCWAACLSCRQFC